MLAMLLTGTVVVCCLMLLLWWLGIRHHNFSYVDLGWAVNFAVLAAIYGTLGSGDPTRRLLICGMYAIAGARLAVHLGTRIIGEPEEGRYQELRRRWDHGGHLRRNFFIFFQAQAALNILLSLPMAIAVMNPVPQLHSLEIAAVAIWTIGLCGESLADWQLTRFRSDPRNRGKVCDVGLWSVSRHPNYFFEWLIWVAYALFAVSAPFGWIALMMPLLMLFFLLFVTGVRPTEAQALRSRGEAYRRYQHTTSMFVPWFPRR
jgi:steroid 5-alpha reductase family enzyme